MTVIAILFPQRIDATLSDVQRVIADAQARPPWPCEMAIAFFQRLSDILLSHELARPYPALQKLGFWLRKASLQTLLEAHAALPPHSLRTPRGTVFQILPSNVDALAGYATALSLLMGNATIARLPTQPSPVMEAWIACLEQACQDTAPADTRLILLRYDHDDGLTRALSALCDLRMTWGGDETVCHIASLPLPAHTRSIGFGDRFSSCAINASAYLTSDEKIQDDVVRLLGRDLLELGQMACSSPRLLYWIGTKDACDRAANNLFPRVARFMDQSTDKADASDVTAKLGATFLALHDLDVESTTRHNAALTIVALRSDQGLRTFKDTPYGHGLLLTLNYDSLDMLADNAERKDQTLSHFGFSGQTLRAFSQRVNGRGFDRIVPLGQALDFDVIWDGENLIEILSKTIRINV